MMRSGHGRPVITAMTDEKKGTSEEVPNFHLMLARPERFERPTPWFAAKYSIQLSYGRAAKRQYYSTLLPNYY
jgi:hypothetical protein